MFLCSFRVSLSLSLSLLALIYLSFAAKGLKWGGGGGEGQGTRARQGQKKGVACNRHSGLVGTDFIYDKPPLLLLLLLLLYAPLYTVDLSLLATPDMVISLSLVVKTRLWHLSFVSPFLRLTFLLRIINDLATWNVVKSGHGKTGREWAMGTPFLFRVLKVRGTTTPLFSRGN